MICQVGQDIRRPFQDASEHFCGGGGGGEWVWGCWDTPAEMCDFPSLGSAGSDVE